MIFAPSKPRGAKFPPPGTDKILAYCERLDVVNQPLPPSKYAKLPVYQAWGPGIYPDYFSGQYVLRKVFRKDKMPLGDIIPLLQFRAMVDVEVRHREKANTFLTCYNVSHVSDNFFLNKYLDKELFYALEKSHPCFYK